MFIANKYIVLTIVVVIMICHDLFIGFRGSPKGPAAKQTSFMAGELISHDLGPVSLGPMSHEPSECKWFAINHFSPSILAYLGRNSPTISHQPLICHQPTHIDQSRSHLGGQWWHSPSHYIWNSDCQNSWWTSPESALVDDCSHHSKAQSISVDTGTNLGRLPGTFDQESHIKQV